MDDNDSIITDVGSLLEHNTIYKQLPKSADNSSDDLTTSSSDAVIKALQTLQQKIKKLELERAQAEQNFGNITRDTEKLKASLARSTLPSTIPSTRNRGDNLKTLIPVSTNTSTTTVPRNTTYPDMRLGDVSIDIPREEVVKQVPQNPVPKYPTQHTFTSGIGGSMGGIPHVDKFDHPTVKVREKWDIPNKDRTKPVMYHPSASQPYTTYIRPSKPKPDFTEEEISNQKLHDSRVSVLEKQLEYMRRLVHNAEQERTKATQKMSYIEQEKENQKSMITQEELEKQNSKIADLEKECSQLSAAHLQAENKIKNLGKKLQKERESRSKLLQQTEELARVTEENKNLMLSITPSLPPTPPPAEKKRAKKKRKRPCSTNPRRTGNPCTAPAVNFKNIPFVCGKSSSPSHSLSANVQQMLSALKHENPRMCARITTQKSNKTAGNDKDIKQVITGLEDDLGALTFEYQSLASTMTAENKKDVQQKLELISQQMETKTQHIRKLSDHLKKLKKEQTVVKARPVPRPLSTLSNRGEVQISVRGSNTRELLSKVKTIREVLTNKDLQWV